MRYSDSAYEFSPTDLLRENRGPLPHAVLLLPPGDDFLLGRGSGRRSCPNVQPPYEIRGFFSPLIFFLAF